MQYEAELPGAMKQIPVSEALVLGHEGIEFGSRISALASDASGRLPCVVFLQYRFLFFFEASEIKVMVGIIYATREILELLENNASCASNNSSMADSFCISVVKVYSRTGLSRPSYIKSG